MRVTLIAEEYWALALAALARLGEAPLKNHPIRLPPFPAAPPIRRSAISSCWSEGEKGWRPFASWRLGDGADGVSIGSPFRQASSSPRRRGYRPEIEMILRHSMDRESSKI